jgi:hypothetical protein
MPDHNIIIPPSFCLPVPKRPPFCTPVAGVDGLYRCGLCCTLPMKKTGIRSHYSNKHRGTPPFEPKMKQRKSPRGNKQVYRRDLYNVEDARRIGNYGLATTILYVGPSLLPNAGNGVYTKEKLFAGDYVTVYSGKFTKEAGTDTEYVMSVNDGYINGIRTARKRAGFGSLINRPNRNSKKANVEFEGLTWNPQVVVRVTRTIKAGSELLGHYGHGYQIHKK